LKKKNKIEELQEIIIHNDNLMVIKEIELKKGYFELIKNSIYDCIKNNIFF
jgi:hypothetical protein